RSTSNRTGPSTTAPGLISPSAMRRMRTAKPLLQLNLRSSSRTSPPGRSAASVTSKFELRLTVKLPGLAPPMRKPLVLPALSRPRSEIAISVPARGKPFGTNTRASIPLLGGQRAQSRRQRDRPAPGKKALLAVIKADDLMDAFDAHIERATVLRDRFRVIPTARRQRSPVGTQDRRHFSVRDAARPRALVDDAAAKPPTLVG